MITEKYLQKSLIEHYRINKSLKCGKILPKMLRKVHRTANQFVTQTFERKSLRIALHIPAKPSGNPVG